MNILAIETSCDETSIALVEASATKRILNGAEGANNELPSFKIKKVLIASQIEIHRPFGGVVPNLAKREHEKNLPILYRKILGLSEKEKTQVKEKNLWKKIDLIAVTVGPGLEPALWAGINFAEELAKKHKKPLVGANHLEGHLYSFLLSAQKKAKSKNPKSIIPENMFPAIGLIVSGGHTILLRMRSLYEWRKIGETRDDAIGEAYDKVARLLNMQYPGGPEVERLSHDGDPKAINFPRPMIYHKNYDFSFSGLKTAVRYYVITNPGSEKNIKTKADIAASFQEAALDVLIKKTNRAIDEFGAETLFISGGVSINGELRRRFKKELGKKAHIYFPKKEFCNDNAAMIAIAAYMKYIQGKKYRPAAQANLNM